MSVQAWKQLSMDVFLSRGQKAPVWQYSCGTSGDLHVNAQN
jgi:hypothetical protein